MTPVEQITFSVDAAALPFISNYSGPWAMHEPAMRLELGFVQAINLALHIEQQQQQRSRNQGDDVNDDDDGGGAPFTITDDGIALVGFRGTMTKQGSSFSEFAGTVAMRRTLRTLANRDDVNGILLVIDSPGGSVAGTFDLADDIASIAEQMPVHAHIEDIGASAAYACASQCGHITAGRTAMVGSIGTYTVLTDTTKAQNEIGIKAVLIAAGEHKGLGADGKIDDNTITQVSRVINELNDQFVDTVARGRGFNTTQARQLADGRVHVGPQAEDLQLVDAIGSLDQAMTTLRAALGDTHHQQQDNSSTNRRGNAAERRSHMSSDNATNTPQAASHTEIKAACTGCDADFILSQLEQGATIEQARDAWTNTLAARLENSNKERDEANARAAQAEQLAKATPQGVEPLGDAKVDNPSAYDSDQYDNARDAYFAALDAEITRCKGDRLKATRAVEKKHPGLRAEMLAEINQAA